MKSKKGEKTAVLLDGKIIRVDKRIAAAAPELLAALEKLEARLDWFLSDDFSEAFGLKYKPLAEELSELEQARAAIAKAKGAA